MPTKPVMYLKDRGDALLALGTRDVYLPRHGHIIYFREWMFQDLRSGYTVARLNPFVDEIGDRAESAMAYESRALVARVTVSRHLLKLLQHAH